MITVYHETDGWLKATDNWGKGNWIHVENPDEREIEALVEHFGVPRKFLHAALDPREVARSDSANGRRGHAFHMVIVRAPYESGAADRVPYRTIPLAMIIAPDHFITVCRAPIDFVRDLNYNAQGEELPVRRAGRATLEILRVVAERYLLYLETIDRRLEDVEDRLKDSIENSEMLELLRYEKSLVYMKTGLDWNDQMISRLREKEQFGWDEADGELFDDVRVEYRQGFHMAETMLTVLEAMTDAFASLISNNLNVVMKFLAAVTIVLTVPMLVASIYGMNVILPGESYPYMALVLMLISAVLTLIVARWFYRRGWLSIRWRR